MRRISYLIILYFVHLSMSPRPKRKKVTTAATSMVPDRDQPLSYWHSLPKEVLVLACNKHHLIDTGSVAILARRLYDFHQNRQRALYSISIFNATTSQYNHRPIC